MPPARCHPPHSSDPHAPPVPLLTCCHRPIVAVKNAMSFVCPIVLPQPPSVEACPRNRPRELHGINPCAHEFHRANRLKSWMREKLKEQENRGALAQGELYVLLGKIKLEILVALGTIYLL
uniref:Uncharacterized protein n=1 Tax=Leersia perrieri TaxID=77586 RepID=A0A0D9WI76_9ORYZ